MTLGNRFILAGIVYVLIGMSLGIFMGATQNFTLHGVHAHINLLGWVTMVLFGLIYRSKPAMESEKLAGIQFWVSNLAFIVMMITLTLFLKGNESVVPVLAASEFVAVAGMLMFGSLVWKHRMS